MNRSVIINKLLEKSTSRRYLEIGGESGANFLSVRAKDKVCVNPRTPSEQVTSRLGPHVHYHLISSDMYFSENPSTEFDVILVDGLHDEQQVLADITNSLDHISAHGFIVCHDCLPRDKTCQLNRNDFEQVWQQAIRDKAPFHAGWTGPVWRAIVRMRMSRKDLVIFTLNCDWGCAVITRGEPDHLLATDTLPDYEQFAENTDYYLNLKDPTYLYEFIFKQRGQPVPRLYVEDYASEIEYLAKDRFLPDVTSSQSISHGVILPCIPASPTTRVTYLGGVVDNRQHFVAGLARTQNNATRPRTIINSYPYDQEKVLHSDEIVLFGGGVWGHFGHVLVDALSRLWWLARNPQYTGRVAYVLMGTRLLYRPFVDIMALLGVPEEKILIVEQPTQFSEILVPDQTFFSYDSGYKEKFTEIFHTIRDQVRPGNLSKVYLTRTQLTKQDTVNEEYFETFYRNHGWNIVAPEKLSVAEQVSMIAGADELACVEGTLSHLVLFAKEDVKLTILKRTSAHTVPQSIINQATGIDVTYVDVSMNFLPTSHATGAFLMGPTPFFRQYAWDQYQESVPDFDIDSYVADYIRVWVRRHGSSRGGFGYIRNRTPVDFVESLSKYVSGHMVDRKTII